MYVRCNEDKVRTERHYQWITLRVPGSATLIGSHIEKHVEIITLTQSHIEKKMVLAPTRIPR